MDNGPLKVYVGDELAAVATPIDSLYYLTIQSDQVGAPLRFELNGERLEPIDISTSRHLEISNIPDSHNGSLRRPIVLRPAESSRPYKTLENNHVIIIRNNERYDVTGKRLNDQ